MLSSPEWKKRMCEKTKDVLSIKRELTEEKYMLCARSSMYNKMQRRKNKE